MTLDRLTKRINRVAPIARIKDGDDEAQARFVTKAVAGKRCRLHAHQRIPLESSFQRSFNALCTTMREIGTLQQQSASEEKRDDTGVFRKSLRKKEKKHSSNGQIASETFTTWLLRRFSQDRDDGRVTRRRSTEAAEGATNAYR